MPHTWLLFATHSLVKQLLKPKLQATSHEVPLQVAAPWGSVGHAVHLDPQVLTLLLETQAPPQLWKPLTQLASEQVPVAVSQAPVPLAKSVVQLVREAPQTVSLLASQPPLKAWKPVLQATMQVPAVTLHVEVEFGIAVQLTGGEPQAVSVFGVQPFPLT